MQNSCIDFRSVQLAKNLELLKLCVVQILQFGCFVEDN